MCGRYVRKTGAQEIAHAFSAVDSERHLALNFNISPTSDVFVLRAIDGVVRLDGPFRSEFFYQILYSYHD